MWYEYGWEWEWGWEWLEGVLWFSSALLFLLGIQSLFGNPELERRTTTNTPSASSSLALFFVLYEFNVKRVMICQEEESHATLRKGVESVLHELCPRPVVFLLLAPSGPAYLTALCLAESFARVLLAAFNRSPPTESTLSRARLQGTKFASFQDYWRFHGNLERRMDTAKVVIVTEFERVHPQLADVLCHLVDDAYSPYPQSVVILVADMSGRFSERDVATKSLVSLAETYMEELLGPSLDSATVTRVKRVVTGRPVLVRPEPISGGV